MSSGICGSSTVDAHLRAIELVLEDAIPEVELHPASGLSLTSDHWIALLPELGLQHVGLGIDAAMNGLVRCAATVAEDRLAQADYNAHRARLLLRLSLERQRGTLGPLLKSSARLYSWEYEDRYAEEPGREQAPS